MSDLEVVRIHDENEAMQTWEDIKEYVHEGLTIDGEHLPEAMNLNVQQQVSSGSYMPYAGVALLLGSLGYFAKSKYDQKKQTTQEAEVDAYSRLM